MTIAYVRVVEESVGNKRVMESFESNHMSISKFNRDPLGSLDIYISMWKGGASI